MIELQNDRVGEDGAAIAEPATILWEITLTAKAEPVLLGITKASLSTGFVLVCSILPRNNSCSDRSRPFRKRRSASWSERYPSGSPKFPQEQVYSLPQVEHDQGLFQTNKKNSL